MTPDAFISSLKIQVHDSAIRNTLTELTDGPPGRRPPPRLTALAEWFNSIRPEDRRRIHEVVGLAVHHSIFGVLCFLDGVRAIDDGSVTRLELHAVARGQRTVLTSDSGEMLHELYQSATYSEVFGPAAG